MRKIAPIRKSNNDGFCRVMVCSSDEGYYLFLYDSHTDGSCKADYLYNELDKLYDHCKKEYGIDKMYWQEIEDPLPEAQQDWIAPTRIKRNKSGNKQFGEFEPIL